MHTAFSDRQAGRNFLLRFSLTCYSRKREIDGLTWLQAQRGTFPLRSLYPYTSAYLSQVSGQGKEPRGQEVSGSALRAWHALYPFQFRQVGPHGSETGWGQEKGERSSSPEPLMEQPCPHPDAGQQTSAAHSSLHSASWQWVLIPHWTSREMTVNHPPHTYTHTQACAGRARWFTLIAGRSFVKLQGRGCCSKEFRLLRFHGTWYLAMESSISAF